MWVPDRPNPLFLPPPARVPSRRCSVALSLNSRRSPRPSARPGPNGRAPDKATSPLSVNCGPKASVNNLRNNIIPVARNLTGCQICQVRPARPFPLDPHRAQSLLGPREQEGGGRKWPDLAPARASIGELGINMGAMAASAPQRHYRPLAPRSGDVYITSWAKSGSHTDAADVPPDPHDRRHRRGRHGFRRISAA